MLKSLLLAYFLLQIPLKAFLYRARGMSNEERHTNNIGDTQARILFWGLPWAVDGTLFAYLLGAESRGALTVLFIMLALLGWAACAVRHSAWQSPSWHNYFCMGIITTIMLTVMVLPLTFYDPHLLFFLPLGMLGTVASWLGYSKFFANRTLKLFGITWCVPGDSSWEEWFIGPLPFGVMIAAIGIYLLL